ncbi:venom allergen 5-like [Aphidius gifuensis]|uniref:venom allergen 5-like n=1 Tax=Aphidius gifuensis TaxID=684658 RepID=UPI001CDC24C8|nr:venom allergen 5-like [Aphidius gifuensis]
MATTIRLVTVIVTILIASVAAFDYCQIQSCQKGQHTMCKYFSKKPGKTCNKFQRTSISSDERNEILKVHNMFRKTVANGKEPRGSPGPQPAGIIKDLKWDKELANIAQRWANQCVDGHDECRNTKTFGYVGQNWALMGDSRGWTATMTGLIKGWYEEVQYYNKNNVEKFRRNYGPVTGHYTQMVWGQTTHIGCGVARYYRKGYYTTVLVCNYGPGGNILDRPVYQIKQL